MDWFLECFRFCFHANLCALFGLINIWSSLYLIKTTSLNTIWYCIAQFNKRRILFHLMNCSFAMCTLFLFLYNVTPSLSRFFARKIANSNLHKLHVMRPFYTTMCTKMFIQVHFKHHFSSFSCLSGKGSLEAILVAITSNALSSYFLIYSKLHSKVMVSFHVSIEFRLVIAQVHSCSFKHFPIWCYLCLNSLWNNIRFDHYQNMGEKFHFFFLSRIDAV